MSTPIQVVGLKSWVHDDAFRVIPLGTNDPSDGKACDRVA